MNDPFVLLAVGDLYLLPASSSGHNGAFLVRRWQLSSKLSAIENKQEFVQTADRYSLTTDAPVTTGSIGFSFFIAGLREVGLYLKPHPHHRIGFRNAPASLSAIVAVTAFRPCTISDMVGPGVLRAQ